MMKNLDEYRFQQDLLNSGLDVVETISNSNTSLNIFYSILNKVLEVHAPIKEKRVKREHQPDWFTKDIKEMIRARDNCHKIRDFDKYKILRNKVSSMIKRAKKNFFNKAIECNKDTAYVWKNLKDISNLNQKKAIYLPSKLERNGTVFENEKHIVNEFNKHFVDISSIITKTPFSEQNYSDLKDKLDTFLENNIFDIPHATILDIKDIITKLNSNKSTGLDGIGPKILKHCGDIIVPYITCMINNSIDSGIFPNKLKEGRVLPIFKNGKKELAENYRPISILPTISKIFERYIATHLQSYFKNTNILHDRQSGFRKNHSCHTALIHLIDEWIKDVDSGKVIGAIFLDLRKAFDLVDHEILLHKLKLYHFSNKAINLFKSYLSNRRQIVQVGNIKSDFLEVKSGVPQGSILGPLLFLIYINDISFLNNNHNIDLYADDSWLYKSGHHLTSIQDDLQLSLNSINEWCHLNNMSIHTKKTTCMLIGSPYKLKKLNSLVVKLDNIELENITVKQLLGVFIDNTLSWKYQIENICKKVNSKIALFKSVIFYLNNETKAMFYNGYILPIFDYCCTIWGKGTKGNLLKVQRLQTRIAKIILCKPRTYSASKCLNELKWLSFKHRVHYHLGVMVYKILNDMVPAYMKETISFADNKYHKLRSHSNKNLVLLRKPRTNYLKDSFSYCSLQVWNKIPLDVKHACNLSIFKANLKKYFINIQQNQFYKC